jgi:hypothetical protein
LEENPNKTVQLMSASQASNLVASLYPPGAVSSVQNPQRPEPNDLVFHANSPINSFLIVPAQALCELFIYVLAMLVIVAYQNRICVSHNNMG